MIQDKSTTITNDTMSKFDFQCHHHHSIDKQIKLNYKQFNTPFIRKDRENTIITINTSNRFVNILD